MQRWGIERHLMNLNLRLSMRIVGMNHQQRTFTYQNHLINIVPSYDADSWGHFYRPRNRKNPSVEQTLSFSSRLLESMISLPEKDLKTCVDT